VAMFEHAIEAYGSVDVVVANAGITEYPPSGFRNVIFKDGKPQPLSMRTLDVNLKGVCWSESKFSLLEFQPDN
jgi:NAD(P)-dependent dehydrogenase (short-subunit alcohol dehydrogenase family)